MFNHILLQPIAPQGSLVPLLHRQEEVLECKDKAGSGRLWHERDAFRNVSCIPKTGGSRSCPGVFPRREGSCRRAGVGAKELSCCLGPGPVCSMSTPEYVVLVS